MNDLAIILVTHGPVEAPKYNFSSNNNERQFTDNCYSRNLPNGENINNEWFVYSCVSKDSVDRFCCKLFGSTSSLCALNRFSD